MLLCIFVHAARLACHGNERQKAVAAVDIQNLRNGSKLVRGIVLAVSVQIITESVVSVLLAERDLITQIVTITALAMHDLTKQPLLDHIHDHHLDSAVAAVFKEHKGCSGLLIGAHQIPALIDGVSTTNLHANCNALLHCFNGDRHVRFPRRKNHHGIRKILIKHVMPIRACKRCRLTMAYNRIHAPFYSVFVRVAYCGHNHIIHV